MSDLSIRIALISDAEALSALGAKTFSDKFAHLYKPEDLQQFLDESHSVEAYQRSLSDPQTRIWVAVANDGALAGYAVAGPCTLPVDDCPDGAMEIARLYMDEAFHGQGTGRKLMDLSLIHI